MNYIKEPYANIQNGVMWQCGVDKSRSSLIAVIVALIAFIVGLLFGSLLVGLIMGAGAFFICSIDSLFGSKVPIFAIHRDGLWIGLNKSINMPMIGFLKFEWIREMDCDNEALYIFFNEPDKVMPLLPKSSLKIAGMLSKDSLGERYLAIPMQEYFNRDEYALSLLSENILFRPEAEDDYPIESNSSQPVVEESFFTNDIFTDNEKIAIYKACTKINSADGIIGDGILFLAILEEKIFFKAVDYVNVLNNVGIDFAINTIAGMNSTKKAYLKEILSHGLIRSENEMVIGILKMLE